MSSWERKHVEEAFCFELSKVREQEVRDKIVNGLIANIDSGLASRVGAFLGSEVLVHRPTTPSEPCACLSLSMAQTARSAATRKVAILLCDGFDGEEMQQVCATITDAKAHAVLISCSGAAPVQGQEVPEDDPPRVKAPVALCSTSSAQYDAVFVPRCLGDTRMVSYPLARRFISDSFAHSKPIGVSGDSAALLPPGAEGQPGVVVATKGKSFGEFEKEFAAAIATVRHWDRIVS
jgi:catalase